MKIKDWLQRGAISCVLAISLSTAQAALNANNADIVLDANIPTMQVAINPGGKGCTTVQEWDSSTGGCRNLSDTAKVISVVSSASTMGAANGSVSLVAVVTSKSGKRVPYAQVTWSTNNGTLAYATSTTNAQGEATNVLSNARLGSSTVTASAVNGGASVTVAVSQTSVVASLVATPASVIANGTAYSTLIATLRDANGNAAGAGEPVAWSTNLGSLSTSSSTSNAASQATATISSLTVGTATVTARAYGGASTTVAFTTPVVAPVINSFAESSATMGGEKSDPFGKGDIYKQSNVVAYSPNGKIYSFGDNSSGVNTFTWSATGADRFEILDPTGAVVYTGSGSATSWRTNDNYRRTSPGMISQSDTFKASSKSLWGSGVTVQWTLIAYSGSTSTRMTVGTKLYTDYCGDCTALNQIRNNKALPYLPDFLSGLIATSF